MRFTQLHIPVRAPSRKTQLQLVIKPYKARPIQCHVVTWKGETYAVPVADWRGYMSMVAEKGWNEAAWGTPDKGKQAEDQCTWKAIYRLKGELPRHVLVCQRYQITDALS